MEYRLRFFYLTVIGCSKDSNDIKAVVDASQIVGTWQITQISADPAVNSSTYGMTTDVLSLYQQNIGKDCVGPTRYVFAADNTLRLMTSTDCQNRLTSLFGFTSAAWRTDGRQLRIEGSYDALVYTVIQQSVQDMTCQRTEYNSPFDGKTHLYTITKALIRNISPTAGIWYGCSRTRRHCIACEPALAETYAAYNQGSEADLYAKSRQVT